MKSFKDFKNSHEVSHHCGSLLSCVVYQFVVKKEKTPRFLRTMREHEVFATSYVLVGFVEGC